MKRYQALYENKKRLNENYQIKSEKILQFIQLKNPEIFDFLNSQVIPFGDLSNENTYDFLLTAQSIVKEGLKSTTVILLLKHIINNFIYSDKQYIPYDTYYIYGNLDLIESIMALFPELHSRAEEWIGDSWSEYCKDTWETGLSPSYNIDEDGDIDEDFYNEYLVEFSKDIKFSYWIDSVLVQDPNRYQSKSGITYIPKGVIKDARVTIKQLISIGFKLDKQYVETSFNKIPENELKKLLLTKVNINSL